MSRGVRAKSSLQSRRQLGALKIIGLVVAALWLLSARAEEAVYHGTVMRVSGGEKLLVRTRHRTFRVRLAGIRTPGMSQPFGKAAENALRRLLSGLWVGGADHAGRLPLSETGG